MQAAPITHTKIHLFNPLTEMLLKVISAGTVFEDIEGEGMGWMSGGVWKSVCLKEAEEGWAKSGTEGEERMRKCCYRRRDREVVRVRQFMYTWV